MLKNKLLICFLLFEFVAMRQLYADSGRHLSIEDFAEYSLTSLNNKINEIENNNDRLSLENDVLRQKITGLSQELAILTRTGVGDKNNLIDQEKKKEIFLLESKFERLQKDLGVTIQFNQSLQIKLENQQKQSQLFDQQISKFKPNLKLSKNNSKTQGSVKNSDQFKDKLRNLIKEQQSLVQMKDKELAILTRQMVGPKVNLSEIKGNSNLLKQKIALLNDEMGILKSDENKSLENIEQVVNQNDGALKSLDVGIVELKNELSLFNETLSKVNKKLGNRLIDPNVHDIEAQNLKESLNTTAKEKELLEKQIIVLESKLTQTQVAQ